TQTAPPKSKRLSQNIGIPEVTNVQSLIFVMKWTLACLVGEALGQAVVVYILPESLVDTLVGRSVVDTFVGVFLGAAQWVVMRRRISSSQWWILATAIGLVFDTFASGHIDFGIEILAGIALGTTQWLVLRRSVSRAAWWI